MAILKTSDPLGDPLEMINVLLKDEHFEDRYRPRFEWFESKLPCTRRILNVGCGQGRETFALLWHFNADEAVGIGLDDDPKIAKIFTAQALARTILEFPNAFSTTWDLAVRRHPTEYLDRLQAWYENDLPSQIKDGKVPRFYEKDVSEGKLSLPPNHFDLVYSRYVLDKIIDSSGEEGLIVALENMKGAVNPEGGRIVLVVPTKRKNSDGKFEIYPSPEPYFTHLGLLMVEPPTDEDLLGGTEDPGSEPKGYILSK